MNINRIVRETFVVEAEHHTEITSTNDWAAQRARHGANKLPLLVIADRQTAGRGRGGNRWWTGPESLAFSLLLDPKTVDARPESVPLISLAAGVATAETIKPLLSDQEVGIHWPNDVIAAGRKLAGILVEVLPDRHIIIGIGINTNNTLADAPAELLPIAATLRDLTNKLCDHEEILVTLLVKFENNLLTLRQTPAELCARANELCLQRNKTLSLQIGLETIHGLCQGIAHDGALILETPTGLRSFYSGVVATS